MQLHERLEKERTRLDMTIQAFAAAGGVAPRTYSNYSSGARSPDVDFLLGVHAAGADVLYIVTGIHQGEAMPVAQEGSASDGDSPQGGVNPSVPPAQQAAASIQALPLSEEDAKMVIALAERLARR